MQLRCTYCQTMFAISREDMLAALEHMEENKLIFYDAHCPKCRRANRVERARMERFFPDWKTAIKTMEKDASKAEAAEKPAAKSAPVKAAPAAKKPAPKPKAPVAKPAKKPASKAAPKATKKPAPKPAAGSKKK
jgi:cell division protein FtsN